MYKTSSRSFFDYGITKALSVSSDSQVKSYGNNCLIGCSHERTYKGNAVVYFCCLNINFALSTTEWYKMAVLGEDPGVSADLF